MDCDRWQSPLVSVDVRQVDPQGNALAIVTSFREPVDAIAIPGRGAKAVRCEYCGTHDPCWDGCEGEVLKEKGGGDE